MSGDDTPDSLLYEVSLRVARSVAVDYRRWLSSRVAAIERLRGVLLYGVARPSMQPEAPRISTLEADALEAIAERAREKGLTVRVRP